MPTFTPAVTTPVAYITNFPGDPFAPLGPNRPERQRPTYVYWSVNPGGKNPAGGTYGKDSQTPVVVTIRLWVCGGQTMYATKAPTIEVTTPANMPP